MTTTIDVSALCACEACPRMLLSRRQVVAPRGPADARVMVVGQAPGWQEDAIGQPFVGKSGKWLDNLLAMHAGIDPQTVYVTNVNKCFPGRNGTGDRKPTKKERTTCTDLWLWQEIAAVKPHIIIAVGEPALTVLAPGEKLTQVHGTMIDRTFGDHSCRVFATYHPAAAMRNASLYGVLIDDFQRLKHAAAPPVWRTDNTFHTASIVSLDFETTTPQLNGKFAPSLAELIGIATAIRTASGEVVAGYVST